MAPPIAAIQRTLIVQTPNVRVLPRGARGVAASLTRRSTTQWYGLPPLLYGIAMCQIGNWSCPIHEQGGVRHEITTSGIDVAKKRAPGSRN